MVGNELAALHAHCLQENRALMVATPTGRCELLLAPVVTHPGEFGLGYGLEGGLGRVRVGTMREPPPCDITRAASLLTQVVPRVSAGRLVIGV